MVTSGDTLTRATGRDKGPTRKPLPGRRTYADANGMCTWRMSDSFH